jgi:hypothetical protein
VGVRVRVDLSRDAVDGDTDVIDSLVEDLGNSEVVDSITASGRGMIKGRQQILYRILLTVWSRCSRSSHPLLPLLPETCSETDG